MQEKVIGLVLALISSFLIGTSFIITKKGLMTAKSGADSYAYLFNKQWWAGMVTMVSGEAANFAAYSFAPAVLVTPLGAMSVLVGAVLAHIFLGERLGIEGKLGCALSLLGSILIVLHSPEEEKIESVTEIMQHAWNPAFMLYLTFAVGASLLLIYKVAPVHGRGNVFVYISICSLIGSISVVGCKAFGIAIKLTFSESNQFVNPSTWFFLFVVVLCVVVQMNYFNKALSIFSTNLVTPIYYVFFTTATILANVTLFQGFYDTGLVDSVSIFCGFIVILIGVFLLNTSKPDGVGSMIISDTNRMPSYGILEANYGAAHKLGLDELELTSDDEAPMRP